MKNTLTLLTKITQSKLCTCFILKVFTFWGALWKAGNTNYKISSEQNATSHLTPKSNELHFAFELLLALTFYLIKIYKICICNNIKPPTPYFATRLSKTIVVTTYCKAIFSEYFLDKALVLDPFQIAVLIISFVSCFNFLYENI